MLELRNVNTFYGNIQALRDVNIRINEGEIEEFSSNSSQ